MSRAVFIDRDGVIIRTDVLDGKPYAITSLEALEILPGAGDAIQRLKDAGFKIIVVSNQPDVSAGKVTREFVEAVNAELLDKLAIDEIKVCYVSAAPCYKPKPGMLLEAAQEHDINLDRSTMIGDRWRDIGAGKAAGCMTIFIDMGYSEQAPENPDTVVQNLAEAADFILALED